MKCHHHLSTFFTSFLCISSCSHRSFNISFLPLALVFPPDRSGSIRILDWRLVRETLCQADVRGGFFRSVSQQSSFCLYAIQHHLQKAEMTDGGRNSRGKRECKRKKKCGEAADRSLLKDVLLERGTFSIINSTIAPWSA